MSNIPSGIVEQVIQWDLNPHESQQLKDELEEYFTLRKERIELNLKDITSEQLAKMKHALGLDYSNKPYRNYYYSNSPYELWEDLVQKGYATKKEGQRKGSVFYFVTYHTLKLIYRKNITQKYFNEL